MENLFVTVVNIAYHIAIGVADWQFFSQYEMPYILITLHACCLSDDYGICAKEVNAVITTAMRRKIFFMIWKIYLLR